MVNIPTITDLDDNIIGNLQTEYGIVISEETKVFLRALSKTQAGKMWLLYLAVGDVQKNIFPDLADPEAEGGTLERAGRLKGVYINQGTQGQYLCAVVGSAGATINSGTTFKSDDSSLNPGYLYVLDNAYTLTGSGDTITLRCLTVGNGALLAVTNTLTCTQPLVNINTQVTVSSVSTFPVDAETIEQYRVRVLQAYRLEPQGGAASDYRLWVAPVSGVAQSYPYALSGSANTAAVYVEAILSDSTDGKGTPTTTILDNVSAVLAASNGLKPLTVLPVQVNPVSIVEVDIAFSGTAGVPGISSAQQTIITQALTEAIAMVRPFIPGSDILSNRNDTISINIIIQIALNAAPGAYWTGIVLTVGGSSVTSYNFDFGAVPWVNTITYS